MKNSRLVQFVKQRRKELNLSQVQLSQKSGVGLKFIRDLEQGRDGLRMSKVNQVFALFNAELGPVSISSKDEE